MRNIMRLYVGDLRRLTQSVATLVIVIGLVGVPGLFTWFNVAASWDPFGNTSALRFAVANTDQCYEGDVLPVQMCIGDQVVNELRSNTQLDWTFTTRDDAIDGTKSGKYYAAVVIPPNFSEHMMTFFDSNMKHAQLDYYTDEKLNAMAPKVTGQGADQVAAQINTMFSKIITATALRVAGSISKMMDSPQATQMIGQLTGHMDRFANTMDLTAQTVSAYQDMTDAAAGVIDGAQHVASSTGKIAQQAQDQLSEARKGAAQASDALSVTTQAIKQAIASSTDSTTALTQAIDQTLRDGTASSTDIATMLTHAADGVAEQSSHYAALHDTAAQLLGNNALVVTQLQHIVDQLNTLHDGLTQQAQKITQQQTDLKSQQADIKKLTTQATAAFDGVSTNFDADLRKQFDAMSQDMKSITQVLNQSASSMRSTLINIDTTASDACQGLTSIHSQLATLHSRLQENAQDLRTLSSKIQQALQRGDMNAVRALLQEDPDAVAAKLAAPVVVKRTALFKVSSFGAALTPFYTFIPLWVGALLCMVTLKPQVSRRIREELEYRNLREGRSVFHVPHWQLFIGRWMTVATIALLQATFSCAGSLLFLRVEATHPWAFMLAGWASALVFSFIVYTFVFSFGNIGKALGVLMLIAQISATGGAYPLEILPAFISNITPYLPVTHAIGMARAALFGFYANDFWIALGKLLLFIPPCALFAAILGRPLRLYNRWYQRNIDKAKVIA